MAVLPLPPELDRAALEDVLHTLHAGSDYARGVLDLLRLLGLISGRDAPADEVAAMFMESLRAHLLDGVVVGLRWGDLEAQGVRGVDILRAVEAARAAAVASPTPARNVRVVQAVIKARRGGEDFYLMQYDAHAGCYQPLGGKQEAGDADSAAALRRELMEELGLAAPPGPDRCTLTLIRAAWQKTALSATYGVLTRYTMDFYAVSEVRFPLTPGEGTRWLSRAEIAARCAADGRAITPIYEEALGLDALDALPPAVEGVGAA